MSAVALISVKGFISLPRRSRSFAEYALPASAFSSEISFRTQDTPRFMLAQAMPPPIMPAPRMPTFVAYHLGTSFGRDAPDLIALRLKKSEIRFFATDPTASFARRSEERRV